MNLSKGYMVVEWAPEATVLGVFDTYDEARVERDNHLKTASGDWVSIIEVMHETELVETLIAKVYQTT